MRFVGGIACVASGAAVGALLAWGSASLDPLIGGIIGGGLAFIAWTPFASRGRR